MRRLHFRWLGTAAVYAGLALPPSAPASTPAPPEWAGEPGQVRHLYTFPDNNMAPAPDESDNPFGASSAVVSLGPFATGWQDPDPTLVPPQIAGAPDSGAWDLGKGPAGAIRVTVPIGQAASDEDFISYGVDLQVNVVGYTAITVLPSLAADGYTLTNLTAVDTLAFNDPVLGQWKNRIWNAHIENVMEDHVTLIIAADPVWGSTIDAIEIFARANVRRVIKLVNVTIDADLGAYDGTAKPATVTTVPTNLTMAVTYDGLSTAPTNAGSYTVVATIVDPNWGGSATQVCNISQWAVTITVDAQVMQVGESLPGLTYSNAPALVVGDVFSGGLACNTNPGTVGTYPITQGTLSAGNNYSITYLGANLVIVDIKQTGVNFRSPGTATGIKVEFLYPTNGELTNLTWTPTLPAGWALVSATNVAGPLCVVGSTSVVIAATGASPVTFWVKASVPGNQASIVAFTNASASFTFTPTGGSAIAKTLAMHNEAVSWRIHSADYQNPQWAIDVTEMNRVLAYWRIGGYHINPLGYDGYAPGFVEGSVDVARHSADYDGTVGRISAEEASRVIGYWRTGSSYHVNTNGWDGYASGAPATPGPLMMGMLGATAPGATVTQTGPAECDAGGTVTVSCTLTYDSRLLSLSWKPILPAGWQIVSVSGEGSPELLRGEVLWTGTAELPNPLVFTYTVQAPLSARGTVALGSVARPMLQGLVNPQVVPTSQSLLMTVKDTDQSGLPDGWQTYYFGHTGVDPLADPDGDGMNNYAEAVANTIPTDRQSVLAIQVLDMSNGNVVVHWQSASNKTYSVTAAETLAGPFEPVPSGTGIAATLPVNTLEVPMATGRQFLRVEVEP